MHRRSNLTFLLVALLAGAPFTTSNAAADEARQLELTALLGYRGGGDFDELEGPANPNIEPDMSYGFALGWLASPQTRYELIYDLQQTDIQDLNVDLDVEHLHLDVPINERFGFRLEARGYLVSMSSDSRIFCTSGGNCLVRAAGDTMFQYALLGGLGLKF